MKKKNRNVHVQICKNSNMLKNITLTCYKSYINYSDNNINNSNKTSNNN